MCDYSLHSVRTRPAKVGEKLVTHNFGTGTRGFAAPEDCSVAVCLLPGTELAFETPVKYQTALMFRTNTSHTVAIFRKINRGVLHMNHDALEFPDGEIVLLTRLCEGQKATVRFPRRPRPLSRWKPNSASPMPVDIRCRAKRRTRVQAAPSRAASFPGLPRPCATLKYILC
jgi:hypothetical protein